jgi:hypothetical protein
MSEVMARGPNFVFAEEFIRSNHGAVVWEQVLADMPAEARATWQEPLLVTGAYPFSAFKEMLAALARVVGEVPDQETAQMYEFIADKSLSSIHNFFFRFADPSFVIKRYPILWQRFFKSGEVRVPEAKKGEARLEFDLPEIFSDWLQPACSGYSKKAIEMAGGSDLRLKQIEQKELPGGIWRTIYELSWSE